MFFFTCLERVATQLLVKEQFLIGGQIRKIVQHILQKRFDTSWNIVRYYVVSNCGITKILQAIIHGGCPSQTASKMLRGG